MHRFAYHDDENEWCALSGTPIDADDAASRYAEGCTCPRPRLIGDIFRNLDEHAMTTHFTLVPAYGRDYRGKAAIIKDLLAERDFLSMPGGRAINLQQMPAGATLNVRYRQLRSVAVLKVDDLRKQQGKH